jgi:histidinol-phosphate aminotransferase
MKSTLLDRNENRYGPAPACLDLLRDLPPDLLYSYSREFQRGITSQLSLRLAEMNGVDERRILLGYGCEDLLQKTFRAFVRAGDACLLPSSSWWYYRRIIEEVGGIPEEYPVREASAAYTYDLDALLGMLRERPARLLLIASPNNPTGNVFPVAELPALLERFPKVLVILDEAYRGFSDEQQNTAALTDRFPNLIVLRTFSKLYALAGARIGYGITAVGQDRLRRFCELNLGYHRISERLALAALESHEYYEEIRRTMAADRRQLTDLLRTFDGVRAYESEANFLLARFPDQIVAFLRTALTERGLVVKFFDEPAFASCARITLGTREENDLLNDALLEIVPELLARPACNA